MDNKVLVLIAAPLLGHFTQSLQMAEILLQHHNQLSITVLVIENPIDPEGTNAIRSISSTSERFRFVYLPKPSEDDASKWRHTNRPAFVHQLIDFMKPHVREAVKNIENVNGFIVDMLNTNMIDIADELGVPSYLFFTSPSFFLGSLFYLQMLEDEENYSLPDDIGNISEMAIPCFAERLPLSVFPFITTDKHVWSSRFIHNVRGFRRARAILINTFTDLEPYSLSSFTKDSVYGSKSSVPQIYPVGPILNTSHMVTAKVHSDVIEWLDNLAPGSVVFLCFGSMGSFQSDQIKEIANGLEKSGHPFIWSFRMPSTHPVGFPRDVDNQAEVLPKGFLDRTLKFGKVVGWVQQLDILSHPSVGGFVSHCGWNSILESIWCGVPVATWPISGEQQMNAFQVVREFKIGVEISLDYAQTKPDQALIRAEEIENGLRKLMDNDNEVRKNIEDLSKMSRLAISEGGSSYVALEKFIQDLSVV